MSELDDKTATEALRYRKSASNGLKLALIMAACLTLIIGSTLLGGVVARYISEGFPKAPDDAPNQSEAATLSSVLNDYRDQNDHTNSSTTKTPELINRSPALIWKYQDSEEYHVKAINGNDLQLLLSEIKEGKPVEADDAELDCLVWIASGNGEVYSPYLKPSVGNIGYGNLFEYDPELSPSEDFVSAVRSLLN